MKRVSKLIVERFTGLLSKSVFINNYNISGSHPYKFWPNGNGLESAIANYDYVLGRAGH
jgi:hypothetical protein